MKEWILFKILGYTADGVLALVSSAATNSSVKSGSEIVIPYDPAFFSDAPKEQYSGATGWAQRIDGGQWGIHALTCPREMT